MILYFLLLSYALFVFSLIIFAREVFKELRKVDNTSFERFSLNTKHVLSLSTKLDERITELSKISGNSAKAVARNRLGQFTTIKSQLKELS